MANTTDDKPENGSTWSQALRRPRQIFGGGGAFLAALSMLVLNETEHKKNADTLLQARSEMVVVAADTLDPALEGKLVSMRGALKSSAGVSDDYFNVSSQAVALKRQVLMYQWLETSYTEGSGKRKQTVYEYELGWSEEYQNSANFHEPAGHTNPAPSLTSRVDIAHDATFGALKFDNAELVSAALPSSDFYGYEETDEGESVINSITQSNLGDLAHKLGTVPELGSALTDIGWQKGESDYFKSSSDDGDEALGDLIVSFQEIRSGEEITWIGQQTGNTLTPWKSSAGKALFVLQPGHPNSKLLLTQAIKAESSGLSTGRIIGLAMSTFGFAAFAAGLGGVLLSIPLLGRVLGAGLWLGGAAVGFASGIVAILIGWLSARPIVAFLLVAALVGAAAWRILVSGKKLEQAAQLQKAAEATALARQRHAERQTAGTPPPVTQVAHAAPSPAESAKPSVSAPNVPPPPPTGSGRTAFAVPQGAINAPLPDGELPPLEWVSSGSFTPPAVMAKKPTAEPTALPFDSVEARVPPPANAAPSALPPGVKAKVKRMELGEKSGFMLTKIVYIDGPKAGEIMCFELMRGKEVLTRGTQDEVKAALKVALGGA
jgi:hypothetical protein